MGAPTLLKEFAETTPSYLADGTTLELWSDFDGPASDWQALEGDAPIHPFQTYLWVSSWQRHVGAARGIEPRIVLVRSATGRPECLLPLGVRRNLGAVVLTWLGDEHADYQGGLFSRRFLARNTPEGFLRLWAEILAKIGSVDAIHFTRQPCRLEEYDNPLLALSHHPAPTGAYHTVIGSDFDAYYKSKRGSRSRHTDRSKRKKLAAEGELHFAIAEGPDEIGRIVDIMLDQKAERLAEMGASNPFTPAGVPTFLKEVATAGGPEKVVVGHFDCGEEAVAVAYGLKRGDRFYYYIHSMTLGPRGRYSPGKLLMYELIQWSIPHGVRIFDFTVGDEDYKNEWCEGQTPLFENVLPLTMKGRAAAALIAAKSFAKRLIKSVPVLKATALSLRSRLFGSHRQAT